MKASVLLLVIYLTALSVFSALIVSMMILYPGAPSEDLYIDSFTRIIDILTYTFFSLLPFTSMTALLAVIFTVVKRGRSSLLDFLIFIFLCCVVWLLVIPYCFLYAPALRIAFFINGGLKSPAADFFAHGFLSTRLTDYEKTYLAMPVLIRNIISVLSFAADVTRSAVESGKGIYLLRASAGLALASVYGLYSFSDWKLLNALLVIVFWIGIPAVNIYLYSSSFFSDSNRLWLPLALNAAVTLFLCISALWRAIRRRQTAEA